MMIPILKKLKGDVRNNKKIFAFDVETLQTDELADDFQYTKQIFLMGSVVSDGLKRVFWDKKEMQNFILSRTTRDSLIFATNMDFDFNILFDSNENLEKFSYIEKNGRFIIIRSKSKGHEFKFLDTLNFIGASVDKLGKLINHPKLEAPLFLGKKPSGFDEKKQLEEYNVNDSLITFKFALFLQKFFSGLGCKMKNTLSSTGIDLWRRKYQQKDIFQEKRHVIEWHYNAVRGGRTEVFKRGLVRDAYYYDINSMYPSILYEGTDGNGSFPDINTSHNKKNTDCTMFEGISLIRMNVPESYAPVMPLINEGKLLFPYGEIEGWFSNAEIRKAVYSGAEIRKFINSVYYTKTDIPFRDCIKELYELRQSYKREGNEAMQMMVKTLMNGGLFGKFAQKIKNKTNVYPVKSVYSEDDGSVYVIDNGKKKILHKFQARGNYIFENIEIPLKIPIFIMPIFASYTTALSRLKLYSYMEKDMDSLIYCDTDSIVTKKKIYEDSDELGRMKLEKEIKKGIFCRPKFYEIDDKIKIKGVRLKDGDTLNDIFSGSRIFNFKRFTKIKESAVRKIPYGSIIQVDKKLAYEDDKRHWSGRFNPQELQDSSPLNNIYI